MISSTIALVILFLLMSTGRYLWVQRAAPARLHVPLTGGRLLLRQPRGKCIMLGLAALFPALVLGGVGASAWRAGAGKAGLLGTVAAMLPPLMASVHQFLSAFLHRIVVHGFGIERIGVLTRRLVRWDDVASIAHNPFYHWFFVTTSHGAHLWLAEDLRRHRPAEASDRRVPRGSLGPGGARGSGCLCRRSKWRELTTARQGEGTPAWRDWGRSGGLHTDEADERAEPRGACAPEWRRGHGLPRIQREDPS